MCSNYQAVTRADRLLSFFDVFRSPDEPPLELQPTHAGQYSAKLSGQMPADRGEQCLASGPLQDRRKGLIIRVKPQRLLWWTTAAGFSGTQRIAADPERRDQGVDCQVWTPYGRSESRMNRLSSLHGRRHRRRARA